MASILPVLNGCLVKGELSLGGFRFAKVESGAITKRILAAENEWNFEWNGKR